MICTSAACFAHWMQDHLQRLRQGFGPYSFPANLMTSNYISVESVSPRPLTDDWWCQMCSCWDLEASLLWLHWTYVLIYWLTLRTAHANANVVVTDASCCCWSFFFYRYRYSGAVMPWWLRKLSAVCALRWWVKAVFLNYFLTCSHCGTEVFSPPWIEILFSVW